MLFSRRLALLRVVVMAALLVCTLMVVADVYPDHGFCPLEEACAKAHESALGSIHGVPTSMLGLAAFSIFFALTLMPVEWARMVIRPAGFFAALGGGGFIAYQAFVLESFCPLCLVVDAAGIVAGLIAVTWPAPPIRLSGRFLVGELPSARLAWSFAALLLIVSPFALPRPAAGSWVEIPDASGLFADTDAPTTDPAAAATDLAALPSAPAPQEPALSAPPALPALPAIPAPPPPPRPAPPAPPAPQPGDRPIGAEVSATVTPPPPAAPEADVAMAGAADLEPGSGPGEDLAVAPVPTGPRPTLYLVEYLNPYCAHCRATHQRFEKVLAEAENQADIRIRRVYAWGERGYPVWARACAYAASVGREDQLFAELLQARSAKTVEVYQAAQRAGLDVRKMRVALLSPVAPRRLVQDRAIVRQAQLKGLPTLDIGKRRLMGEQGEDALREAVAAALSSSTE